MLYRLPAIELVDNKDGKPVGIQQVIGRRPILAFGNSDGDFRCSSGPPRAGAEIGLLVHHTDAVREFAYDREGQAAAIQRRLGQSARATMDHREHAAGLEYRLSRREELMVCGRARCS